MLCFRAEVFQVVIHYHVHICDDLQIVILISHHYPGQKITKKTTKKQSLNTDKTAQCLKIKKKVSFNIANEARYVYILSGQRSIFEKLRFAVK